MKDMVWKCKKGLETYWKINHHINGDDVTQYVDYIGETFLPFGFVKGYHRLIIANVTN